MPVERFYTPQELEPGRSCTIEDQEFHHLAHVIRCRLGEIVEIVNGKGVLAKAAIEEIGKHSASLRIVDTSTQAPGPEIILAQAIPRMNRLEWVLEKGTELGANRFWLFPGEWSEKPSFSPNQEERMRHLTISAMKQCGRLDLPEILLMPPLMEWPEQRMPILFGDTRESAPPLQLPLTKPLILVVGPERGLSPGENEHLLRKLNAKGVRLHRNILRTETAALALLTLASY